MERAADPYRDILGLTVVGLFRLRRREASPGYTTPFYPLTPVLFLSSIALVLVLLGAGRPREAALGSAVVALGLPAYALFYRKKREKEAWH